MRALSIDLKDKVPGGYNILKIKCKEGQRHPDGNKWDFNVFVDGKHAGIFAAINETPTTNLLFRTIKIALEYIKKAKPAWTFYSEKCVAGDERYFDLNFIQEELDNAFGGKSDSK